MKSANIFQYSIMRTEAYPNSSVAKKKIWNIIYNIKKRRFHTKSLCFYKYCYLFKYEVLISSSSLLWHIHWCFFLQVTHVGLSKKMFAELSWNKWWKKVLSETEHSLSKWKRCNFESTMEKNVLLFFLKYCDNKHVTMTIYCDLWFQMMI